jgi:hypothetical protein
MKTNRTIPIEGDNDMSPSKNLLLYGGLTLAGFFLMRKIPILKTMAVPMLLTVGSKLLKGGGRMQTA